MNRGIKLFSFLLTVVLTSTAMADPVGAIAAVNAIPNGYRDGVLKVSADNAKVNPKKWYIVAHNNNDTPKNFVVSNGELISDDSGLAQNLRSILTGGNAINFSKVKIDSNGAWQAAQKYANSKGKQLATVSYALQQKGKNSAPTWSVWCYTKDGSNIGMIQILATSGEVVTSE